MMRYVVVIDPKKEPRSDPAQERLIIVLSFANPADLNLFHAPCQL